MLLRVIGSGSGLVNYFGFRLYGIRASRARPRYSGLGLGASSVQGLSCIDIRVHRVNASKCIGSSALRVQECWECCAAMVLLQRLPHLSPHPPDPHFTTQLNLLWCSGSHQLFINSTDRLKTQMCKGVGYPHFQPHYTPPIITQLSQFISLRFAGSVLQSQSSPAGGGAAHV